MKTFQTIEEAAHFISSHANTGNEITLNDCLCFGMGVYAYTSECIAERLCSPSELKRVSNKYGNVREYANARENWCDVQARALYQAANRVAEIANKFFNA